jgi:hypothetical protein
MHLSHKDACKENAGHRPEAELSELEASGPCAPASEDSKFGYAERLTIHSAILILLSHSLPYKFISRNI